jgi:PAS domain S-box-containing protein
MGRLSASPAISLRQKHTQNDGDGGFDARQEYNFSMKQSPSTAVRWAAPFILVGLAAVLDALLTPLFSQHSPLFLVAIGIAGWFFGLGPAVLSIGLSSLALARIFWPDIPPYGAVSFAIAAAAITILIESQRRAYSRWRDKDAFAARLLGEYEGELLERKRAQAAELRHSMWLEVTLSSIGDGLIATDERGHITFINPVARKMLASGEEPLEDVNERALLHFVDEDSGEPAASPIRVALGLEAPAEAPRRLLLVNGDGNALPVIANASAMRDPTGVIRGAVLVLHDLTKVRESEQRTAQMARQFEEMNEVVPVPIWTSDTSNQRTYANSRWLELTGRTIDETLGTAWIRAVHPDDVEVYLSDFKQAVQSRTKLEAEYRLLDASGNYRWILERGVPRFDAKGEFLGYIGSCVDITERKNEEEVVRKSEERLRSINAELERVNAELATQNKLIQRATEKKMRFLATMSHELRTPMNSILGFLQLLSEQAAGPLNEKQRRYVNRIQSGGQHLLKVVEQVLDYSKIEAGRLQLDSRDFEVRPVVEEIVAAVLQIDPEKQLAVSINVDANLKITADPHRFRQILYNLLSNASKFTPDRGKISVTATAGEPMVSFSITDTGPGIDSAQAAAIFEEFFQGDSSVMQSNRGTGLGLAITRRLVEAHGGRIRVDSTVGRGSSFIFQLPAASIEPEITEVRAS